MMKRLSREKAIEIQNTGINVVDILKQMIKNC